jgi:hypothetical protein
MKKVLIACEESQAVTKDMRAIGLHAFSCDLKPCSGGRPEWHMQCDIRDVLGDRWDMIIAFPPCTHLASSGAKWFEQKRSDGRQQQAIEFFMAFTKTNCGMVAIENPVGIMSRLYRKPDQIIHPYHFGESVSKKTCLWLSGLPKLNPTNIVDPGERIVYASGRSLPRWYANLPTKTRAELRSKTFPGVSRAMADQWGRLLMETM